MSEVMGVVIIKVWSKAVWDAIHDVALKRIKSAISNPNNLAYFDVKKETEIQCDASLEGIGVCLLQEGKPVYFTSKLLTEPASLGIQTLREKC